MPFPCLTDFPTKFHVCFLSLSLMLDMHIIIIIYEMYAHHNNSDQIINMYTVTQKIVRCMQKSELDRKCNFIFLQDYCPNIFHFNKYSVSYRCHMDMHVCLHIKGVLVSSDFNQSWNVPRKFSKTH